MTATTNEQKRNIKIWKWVCMVAYHFALIMLFLYICYQCDYLFGKCIRKAIKFLVVLLLLRRFVFCCFNDLIDLKKKCLFWWTERISWILVDQFDEIVIDVVIELSDHDQIEQRYSLINEWIEGNMQINLIWSEWNMSISISYECYIIIFYLMK